MKSVIFGKNSVVEALRAGRGIDRIFLSESLGRDNKILEILRLAREMGIEFRFIDSRGLHRLSGTDKHQGILAFAEPIRYVSVQDLFLEAERKKEKPFFIMLDCIEDPYNLGSIIRNADAAGCHGLIIPKKHASPLTETAAKASAGAVEYVRVCQVNSLIHTIEELKRSGLWTVGLDERGQRPFTEVNYTLPVCIVLGSEGEGISTVLKKKCDYLAKIPMKGKIPSLNAAVAAGIVMYEVVRQRHPNL